jgi:IS30 family transposase
VAGKLRLDWSPEQIAGWLRRTHPEDECNQVSHETIYRSLFVQTRGVLKKELLHTLLALLKKYQNARWKKAGIGPEEECTESSERKP